jgi:hypothetical protein
MFLMVASVVNLSPGTCCANALDAQRTLQATAIATIEIFFLIGMNGFPARFPQRKRETISTHLR